MEYSIDKMCDLDTSFDLVCKRASVGSYLAGRGSLTFQDKVIDNKLPYYYTFNISMECPVPRGNCTKTLWALPGYWGHNLPRTDEITFIKCPPKICCSNTDNSSKCNSFDSCNSDWKREGILCSQCYENHTEVLFSQKSIENHQCNSSWILVVAPILVVVILGFAVVVGITDEVVQVFKFYTTAIKPMGITKAHPSIQHQKSFKIIKVVSFLPRVRY